MFDFFNMIGSYDSRKIARFEKDKLFISTAFVTDSSQPYETAISHPAYNNNKLIIVEMYDTKEQAQKGHDNWVLIMTSEQLPKELKDVSTASIAEFSDTLQGNDWRNNKLNS